MPESFLHLEREEQSQIYRALAPQLARSPVVLEKDVWVCWVRWPNRRIHALKAKVLLSGSERGRGFGSVFRHHTQGLGSTPGPFSCLKSPRHAGFRR